MLKDYDSGIPHNRVCIIGEADPFLARLLQRFVKKSGLRVKRAQTGDAVLDFINMEKPAVIVLEPELPGMVRGWEVVKQIHADPGLCQVPLILFAWMKKDQVQAVVGRPIIYLQKPDLHYRDFTAALELAGLKNTLPGFNKPA